MENKLSQTIKRNCLDEFDFPLIEKRWFYRVAQYWVPIEHMYDVDPNREVLRSLSIKGVDLFTFIQRNFLNPATKKKYKLLSCSESIGLLHIKSYDDWFKSLGSRGRFVRQSERNGLKTEIVNIDKNFIKSALAIYNETPVRQGRKYSGYGLTLYEVEKKFSRMNASEVLGAYLYNELIGLILVEYGDRVASLKSFLSLIGHRDKNPNSALMAATVKRCYEKGYTFLTYGNMGYNPGLDYFKHSNGFRIFFVPRYYLPLSTKGKLAIRLGVHRPLEHFFSPTIARALVPFYNKLTKFNPVSSNN